MFIFYPKPIKEKFVLVNCISFWGWRNAGSYTTDILHVLAQVPVLQQNHDISSITISGFYPQIKPWILSFCFYFLNE